MTHIHYKFSSKLSSDTVIFDGPHITLRELKRQIMGREKLRSGDCDLQITNAQTKEEYKEDEGLIPKGSSVIVRRIPIIGARSGSTSKTRNIEQLGVLPQLHNFRGVSAMDGQSSSRASPLFSKMTNLAVEDVSEEDKIKAVLYQSTYNTMNYSTKSGIGLPANYTCYRCGNTGHHIRNCPTTGDKNAEAPLRLKKSTGIPRSFMVEVDDPSIKGAMLTNSGQYAIPAIHAKAYAIGKKEKPPFIPQETPTPTVEEPVPNELVCLICHELLSDAVVIPCCGNSFCDDCIRTALLDSDQHCCPSCGQSDVSPDTLIANKFLRKAVNTFQKERGQQMTLTRGCGATQSQEPTLALSPVPTLPPLSAPQKPRSLQAADPTPVSQVSGLPPTATGHTPASIKTNTSSQPAQSNQERSENAAEVSASPPELVSLREDAPAASQATDAAAIGQLQTVSGTLEQWSSDSAPGHYQPSTSMDNSENSCPTKGASSSSSSYPSVPPPLFTSPHFHPFLSAQQHLTSGYPPGYPPAMPIWMLQTPPGGEWYTQQRRKNERSPPRESTYRHSSSHSNSKSPKSKSSRSYSRSSSRSRSRSRSLSRSRPHSPYSRHRSLHARSHSSYSYGYKRSPTPSSSSSPRLGRRSRSKSPSDHRKKSHSHHHHGKKSSSSRHGTRRRGESPRRGAGGSEKSSLHGQHTERDSSFDPEQQRYLQWEREYKEWCEKYLNSYVSHFHQLPPAPFNLNPASLAPRGDTEGNRNINTDYRLHDRRAARKDDLSPPSQSSSDSCSTQSQSISDTRSSPSHSSNESRSPRSQSSSDGLCTPTEPKELKHRHAGKHKQLPVALTEGSGNSGLQERRRSDKQLVAKKDENTSTLRHKRRCTKRDEEEGGKESSSHDAADSVDDGRRDQRSYDTAHKAGKDGSPRQEKETVSEALDADLKVVRSHKHLNKDYEIKGRRTEKGGERGRYSRQDIEGHHKGKPSKERVRIDTDKNRQPGGKSASDYRSEKSQKRKGEESVSSAQPHSSKYQKTDKSEEPQTCKSECQDPFDKKKPETEKAKERKTRPPTESYIWEGGMQVKAQKRISINISLGGKRKEEEGDNKDPTYLDDGKTGEEHEATNNADIGEEMKLEKENDENEKKEDIKQDEIEPSPIWAVASSSDHKRQMEEETCGEKTLERVHEDFDSWQRALRGTEEELEGTKQCEENQVLQASDRGKWRSIGDGNTEGKERTDGGGRDMDSLVAGTQKEGEEGEDTLGENRGAPPEEMTEEVMLKMTTEEDRTRRSLHGGPHITVVDVSSEDHQERKTVLRTQEQYPEGGATNGEDKPALIQVPRSDWDKEESEENKRAEGKIRVETDAPAVLHPSKTVWVTEETTTSGETEREQDQQRRGDTQRHRAAAMDRGQTRESERNAAVSSSQRRLAPSSGKDRPGSTSSNRRDLERDRRMDTEGQKERERGRINKSPRDERKESQRSKERTRKEEKRSGNSSKASAYRRTSPSSSHPATQKMDSRIKDKQSPHHHHHPEAQSGHYLLKDRRAGSHQSSPSHSGSRSKDRARTSSPLEELSSRDRSKVAKEERKAKGAAEVTKEDKRPRDDRDGGRCEERVDEVDGKWELEEGERPSSSSSSSKSSSSSTGRESFGKERGNELKRKHKEEKRRASPEPLDDWMLRKHKHRK